VANQVPFSIESVVVGHSARMRAIFDIVRVISNGDSAVLVTGETGSGKEVIANVIHHSSARRQGPFVPVSCAVLSETLIESELFGHERGAFTGAVRDRQGRFERAHGGTIFLDDIDDAPLSIQMKLTRVLQDHVVERVGGSRPIPVDVRVIAASKRDPRVLVAEGRFREDLYHRLAVVVLSLPPLRDRREDIPLLARHFIEGFASRRGAAPPRLTPHVEQAFGRYAWPGNVRELENACERIAQTCTCGTVRTGCIAPQIIFEADAGVAAPPAAAGDAWSLEPPMHSVSLDDRLRDVEASLIGWALRVSGGNKSRAAELLHVKRTTLADRISRHGARVFEIAGPAATSGYIAGKESPA
jgi:DNA-binding NtrC family response regulator